ncbi:MAG: hypothetical protein DRJ66_07655 [Thermoprotei archaeon]|nr:MAG: hypothetical protein DRJ66_07655 [Thermoprotei archaeon]RLF19990.1 MAG: hypothetical protein DRZ82_03855 [Thermoprotei archaeon]
MAEVRIIHVYKNPPVEQRLIVRDGIKLSELLYRLKIRYDTAIVAINGTVVENAEKTRIYGKSEVAILDVLDGG